MRALAGLGVRHVFTLTGGHIFPILDGLRTSGISIVDVRHEQTAGFAAEGWARLTRSLGVVAVTAGPGATNTMSALAQASFNSAPVLCLAGRAPTFRWGRGSLQEIDHVPFVNPIAPAKTVTETAAIPAEVTAAARRALSRPRGPQFLDFPADVLFNVASFEVPAGGVSEDEAVDDAGLDAACAALARVERPVIVAGSGVWLDGAEDALRYLAEAGGIPVYMQGQGRGCLAADHPLAFARTRSKALRGADVVVVAGAPMDFRLGFGEGFARADVIHIHPAAHEGVAVPVRGSAATALDVLAGHSPEAGRTRRWVESLRDAERAMQAVSASSQVATGAGLHPLEVYAQLVPRLERDAIVICDGGDFASYAGREVPSYSPGCWLDPGPFGCLGCGPGYALAAKLAHPDRRVVVLAGDGALGVAGMDLETFVRRADPIVVVVGNNGIWGLEKHPMKALFGHDVAADLRPGTRYDLTMESFGGRGFFVRTAQALGPALDAALESGEPCLVNVLLDPKVAYPRSSNLM